MYRFRGLLTRVDVGKIADNHPKLVEFRTRIEQRMTGTRAQRQKKARDLTEALIVAAFDDFGTKYVDEFASHIDRIVDLREQIQAKYAQIQGLDPSKPIPPDLTPDSLNSLFSQLEAELKVVEGASPANHFQRHWRDVPTDNVGKLLDDQQRGVDARFTHELEPDNPTTKPDLDLDDPLNPPRPRTRNEDLPDVSETNFDYNEFKTPDGGRIKQVEGNLGVPGEVRTHRNDAAQTAVAGGTRDHAGHLIGNQFGAKGGPENLSRQSAASNLNSFKDLETDWANALKSGAKVHARVRDYFKPGADRPFMRTVDWTITYPGGRQESNSRTWMNAVSHHYDD